MKERVIAKRYGRAIFDLAVSAGEGGRLSEDFLLIKEATRQIPSFVRALSDGRVGTGKRMAAVSAIARELNLSEKSGAFLKLLVKNGRASILGLILSDFAVRFEHNLKLAVCSASVAEINIADETREKIEEIVGKVTGTKATCSVNVSPPIIGGFLLKIGDVKYDASLKGKLERMKEKLWKSA